MVQTKLVGIVNVTPDSFSDGGCYDTPKQALAHMQKLISDGANMIDIGAESTRPGATALSAEEEWERLKHVVDDAVALAAAEGVELSIDTRHGVTAQRVLDRGVQWINDVSGCSDPLMLQALQGAQCSIIVMHNLGVPAYKDVVVPEHEDVIAVISSWLKRRLAWLESEGITRDRIVLDPGVGFGKTAQQSLTIIERVEALQLLDVPLYVGHSRKSFIKLLSDDYENDKDAITLQMSVEMARHGVTYLRVHDIAAHHERFKEVGLL